MLLIEIVDFSALRLFKVYLVFPIIAVMLTIFGLKIKQRGQQTRQTQFATSFFFITASSMFLNMIYAPFASEPIQRIGNNLAIAIINVGFVCLLAFSLSLKYSEREFTRSRFIELIGLVILLDLVFFFIPDGTTFPPNEEGVVDYYPYWNMPFVIYGLVITNLILIPALLIGFQVSTSMKDLNVRKKLHLFIIGVICLIILYTSNYLGNGKIIPNTLFTVLSILIIPGGICIYLGVGKSLKA